MDYKNDKLFITMDEDGNTKVYASIYNPDEDAGKLLPIETEEEWEVIENILEGLANGVDPADLSFD